MIIRIAPDRGPPADQLVTQIAASIGTGEAAPGERLPTVRRLAADLGLAPGTVAKAYTELQRQGWVHAQGRRGTIVADRPVDASDQELERAASALAQIARSNLRAPSEAHRALDVAFARALREA